MLNLIRCLIIVHSILFDVIINTTNMLFLPQMVTHCCHKRFDSKDPQDAAGIVCKV